ncbi:MAG: hypothetical protein A2Y94_09355 [Caldithrix sp. RBG_13_44_9]|nr:MAG: hypothetical protein A2Y94_09355 [Caldithrix sp. RBG_13_44_9]
MGTIGKIVFRGYAKKENQRWVAICIDLNIAAQGETSKEAIKTCYELIEEYLEFVCHEYPNQLHKYIPRPAPQEFIDEYNSLMRPVLKNQPRKFPQKIWSYEPDNMAFCGA